MLILNDIFTDSPRQSEEILLPDNTTFTINLYYNNLTSSWFFDILYPASNFTLLGQKLTSNPNVIHNFRNKLKFGLSFIVKDGGELWYKDDFTSGRVDVYLLDETDLQTLQQDFYEVE